MRCSPVSPRSLALLALLSLAVPALSQTPTTFTGKLDPQLRVDPRGYMFTAFDAGTPADEKRIDAPLQPSDKLYLGKVRLPAEPPLTFDAAILRSSDGSDILYVDTDRDGRFEARERTLFQTVEGPGSDARIKDKADFEVPLPASPYKTCPMQIQLVKPGVPTPPIKPDQLFVLPYSGGAFVEGTIDLPGRTLRIRFDYDFRKNAVDLTQATEYVDLNGDGQFDESAASPEMVRARGKPPVFRLGGLFLSAQSVDLRTGRFVLASRSQAEYERLDLAVGSVVPDFTFTDLDGAIHHLSDVKGTYRLLDFWGTWCRPCVASLPSQKKAYAQFHDRGFEILGMNGEEDSLDKPRKLLRQNNISWPQARFDKDLYYNKFQIALWPTLILIDAQGKIVSMGEHDHLPLDEDNLEKTLNTLLPATP